MEKIRRYGLTKTQIEELSNFCKENIDPIKEKYNKINKKYKQFNVVFGPDKENRKLLRDAVVPILWETSSSFKDRMIANGYKKPTYVIFFEEDIITYIKSNYNDLYEFFGFRDGKEPFERIIGNSWEGLISMLRNKLNVSGSEVYLGDKSFNIFSLWEVKDYHKFFEDMSLDKIPDDILKTSRNLVKVVDDLIKDLNPEKINRVKFIVSKYMEKHKHKFINDEAEATQYINKFFQEVDFFDIDKKEKEEAERLKRKESLNTDIKVIKEKLSELKMKQLKLEDEKLNGTMSVENFNIHMKNIKDMEVGLNNLLKEKMNYHE